MHHTPPPGPDNPDRFWRGVGVALILTALTWTLIAWTTGLFPGVQP